MCTSRFRIHSTTCTSCDRRLAILETAAIGRINIRRVVWAGLAAGLVFFLADAVDELVVGSEIHAGPQAIGKPEPQESAAMFAYLLCFCSIFGIALVWLYAAIRPRSVLAVARPVQRESQVGLPWLYRRWKRLYTALTFKRLSKKVSGMPGPVAGIPPFPKRLLLNRRNGAGRGQRQGQRGVRRVLENRGALV